MRKIELHQGRARAGVCADAQCYNITWLEELVSESKTIQAQEVYTVSGKIAGRDPAKLYMIIGWLFANISGLLSSFGLALFMGLEEVVLLLWIAAAPSGESK